MEVTVVREVQKKAELPKNQAPEDYPRAKPFTTGGGSRPGVGPISTLRLDVVGEESPVVIGCKGEESGRPMQPPHCETEPPAHATYR